MKPIDNKIAMMNRLLEEMTHWGRRLDDIQDYVFENREVIKALRAENKIYRDVLEALPQRFFIKDAHLRYILCSEMFASDLERTVDEIIGKVEEDLVPAGLAAIRRQQEMKILKSGQAEQEDEIRIIKGQQKAFFTTKVPLLDDDLSVSGIFGVSVDISAYWNRVVELESINRQMDNLLAGQSQKMKKQEKEIRDLSIDYEKHLLLRDAEIARLKNELQRQPTERDEINQTIQKKFQELQQIVDSMNKHMGRLQKYSDYDEDPSVSKSNIVVFRTTSKS